MPSATRDQLLVAIDLMVRRDPGPPGFAGTVAVGVSSERGELWWIGRFGRTVSTWFSPDLRQRIDAALIVDEARSTIVGDRSLYDRFVDRYFAGQLP